MAAWNHQQAAVLPGVLAEDPGRIGYLCIRWKGGWDHAVVRVQLRALGGTQFDLPGYTLDQAIFSEKVSNHREADPIHQRLFEDSILPQHVIDEIPDVSLVL